MKKDYLSSLHGSEDLQRVDFSLDNIIREAFELFLTEQAQYLMFADVPEQRIARENLESVAAYHKEYKSIISSIIKLSGDCYDELIALKIKQAGAIYVDDFKEAKELQKVISSAESRISQSALLRLLAFPKIECNHQRTDFIPENFYLRNGILSADRSEINKIYRSSN